MDPHRGMMRAEPLTPDTLDDAVLYRHPTTDLLERDACLRALDAALNDAAGGEGRLVLVSGEAGIGKTALVERFVAERRWGCIGLVALRQLSWIRAFRRIGSRECWPAGDACYIRAPVSTTDRSSFVTSAALSMADRSGAGPRRRNLTKSHETDLTPVDRSASWANGTKVTLSPGTTVAYSLAEPKWDAIRDKNKTTVVDLRDDQQGF